MGPRKGRPVSVVPRHAVQKHVLLFPIPEGDVRVVGDAQKFALVEGALLRVGGLRAAVVVVDVTLGHPPELGAEVPLEPKEGDAPMSGFSVVLIASSDMGNFQYQRLRSSLQRAVRDSLRRRWNRSTIPFASG